MKELCRIIKELDFGRDNELITFTTGAYTGETMLLTDRIPVWKSVPSLPDAPEVISKKEMFRERLVHTLHIVICGGGSVGQALCRLSKFLGWQATVIDDRQEFCDMAQHAGADHVICAPFREALQPSHTDIPGNRPAGAGIRKTCFTYDASTCFVIVTRGHSYDLECLQEILKHPFGYLGMMGSHKRAAKMKGQLLQHGIAQAVIDRLHAPVGLEIEAQTPEEIAVSAAGQIIGETCAGRHDGAHAFPEELLHAMENLQEAAALATVIFREGSTPRSPGARMLIRYDGTTVGTVGGGLMEAEVIRTAERTLHEAAASRAEVITVDMTGRAGTAADLVCGGITKVLLQYISKENLY